MGNKHKVPKKKIRKKHNRVSLARAREAKLRSRLCRQPQRLAVLCERVIKKHKLLSHPKNDTNTILVQEFTLVGGKPLRKRKVPSTSEATETQLNKIEEGSSTAKVPETELTRSWYKKRRTYKKAKMPVGRPPKIPKDEIPESILSINPEPTLRIKEEELDLPVDYDPLSQEDTYTVTIKEENQEYEEDVKVFPQTKVQNIVVTPSVQKSQSFEASVNAKSSGGSVVLIPLQNPAPSTSTSVSNFPLATVVMDDIQIFANSVAEQLRTLPVNRALLLQVEIQTMIDNERHLSMHEY